MWLIELQQTGEGAVHNVAYKITTDWRGRSS